VAPKEGDDDDVGMRFMIAIERQDTRVCSEPWKWDVLNRVANWLDDGTHVYVEVFFPKHCVAYTNSRFHGVKEYWRAGYDLGHWDVYHMFVSTKRYGKACRFAGAREHFSKNFGFDYLKLSGWRPKQRPLPPPSGHEFAFTILTKLGLPELKHAPVPSTPNELAGLLLSIKGMIKLKMASPPAVTTPVGAPMEVEDSQ